MNRNTEMHFSNTPKIDLKRSKFEESHSHKTTFNTGDIIPLFVDTDILPGDTVQMDLASLVRMATPIYPIMDNLYMDYYFFFVPHRLVWNHWTNFWGENDDPWTQETEYEVPQIEAPEGGWTEGTIADYMGIPTKIGNISVNAFAFRAYAKIWNDWFRDENLKKNCHIYTDETTRQGTNSGEDYVLDTELGGMPCKAAKMHDYFTSALPSAQRGPAVTIPISGEASINFGNSTGAVLPSDIKVITKSSVHTTGSATTENALKIISNIPANNYSNINLAARGITGYTNQYMAQVNSGENNVQTPAYQWYPVNLYAATKDTNVNTQNITGVMADLSTASAATINALRTAFAIQKYYENAGLHGTRYIEYIRSVFGVTSSDARFQRAEYLGGQRVPINIDQIVQTSSTNEVSPQGNTAGFSCTVNQKSMFTKSFEEHGTLMCLGVVRTEHTYQQGLRKMWTRKKWTDFYNPFFANLGEQPILNENIYAQGTDKDKEAFGYQEAWADYRYKENYVSGYMRSNASGSLDVWHFADDYNELPILGTTWIDEPYSNVDRTIAVTSDLTHQFIGDFFFKTYYTRSMPVYSVPGLIDHI